MFGNAHPRKQGDLGEATAIEWLTRAGATVFVPLGHSPDCDLIVEWDARRFAVQVKTSSFVRSDRFEVMLETRGGNRSWTGKVKKLDPARCDFRFVLVADGRKWFMPISAVASRSHLLLGGPKYAAFQVDRDGHAQSPALDSIVARGDVRVAKGDGL